MRFLIAALLLACFPVRADGPHRLVEAARQQIGVTTGYDGSYRTLQYPGGDVPPVTGVCTDVVIRAYRALGLDLQMLIHEDMKRAPSAYPWSWGSRRPDRNIDHRRVPNIAAFLRRQSADLRPTTNPAQYQSGDVVTWELPGGLTHIGIVSSTRQEGRPLIIHNIGRGAREEDILFAYRITGHYRYPKPEP